LEADHPASGLAVEPEELNSAAFRQVVLGEKGVESRAGLATSRQARPVPAGAYPAAAYREADHPAVAYPVEAFLAVASPAVAAGLD